MKNREYKLKAVGKRYGMLVVLSNEEPIRTPSGQLNRVCRCICDCGKEKNIRFLHLNHGRITSCGCLTQSRNGKSNTPIGKLFSGIRSRCSHYHSERHLYFDKGIKICSEWEEDFDRFESWCKENGYEKGLHIDRIDGNLGYSPDNCRFVTPKENANNTCKNIVFEYKGESKTLSQIIEISNCGLKYTTVYARIKRGWSLLDSLKPLKRTNIRN